ALKDHIHQLKNELDKNTATFTNLKEQMALQESRHQDELASKEEGFQKQLQDQKTRLEKELANTKEIRSQAVDLERKVEDISEQFTEERQALQSIVKIGELMSVSLRPEEIARRACQIPLNFIGCKRSFTFLRDPDSDCFVPVHGLGFDRSGMTLLKATKLRAGEFPILTDLFQRKSAVLIDDCRKSPNEGKVHIGDGQVETFRCATPLLSDAYIERFQIYSLLAIPFISKGELTGVMFVDFGLVRHRFSSVEILAMDGLGQLIGISLDNIYTHQDTSKRLLALERQARTTSALEEIEEAVASTNQTERMIETVLSEAPRVIGCEGVSVLLADKQAGGFYVLGDLENLKRNEGIIPFVQTSFHGILRADQILYRPNLESEGGLARLDLDLLKHG
ncbi:MAG TPA: GAF domain-containing protein, partial [Nitrospiria bacterium]|nr:GAF domain-containing protein [Nitrospiria bacterium]